MFIDIQLLCYPLRLQIFHACAMSLAWYQDNSSRWRRHHTSHDNQVWAGHIRTKKQKTEDTEHIDGLELQSPVGKADRTIEAGWTEDIQEKKNALAEGMMFRTLQKREAGSQRGWETTSGFLLINLFILNWRLITLQYCSGFCHTLTQISHGCTCVPHPETLPPSCPSHLLGSSQCTSPEYPVSCMEPGVVIYFTYGNIHVSMLVSQIIPPLPSPTESKSQFYVSVSLLLSRI